ncbi:hypothetical protein PRNP1_005373 [Phytophthora ramorum]
MSKGDCETYEAFKARRRREFDTRHAGQTEATQQKLLRVHLRHFLLTVGTNVAQERQRTGACSDTAKDNAGGASKTESFASEQKRVAVAREAAKAQRHRSARAIQYFVRRRIRSVQRGAVADEDEEELPSTSVLIAVKIERPAEPLAKANIIAPMDVRTTPAKFLPQTGLPPFEVVIELVAARDLTLGSFDGKYVEAELLLKRQSDVIARAVSPRQFVSSFQDSSAEILLQDCSLRFAIDLNNGIRHEMASPQSVIDECSASIIVKAAGSSRGGNASTLGVVGIPLFLLETPLAIQYALCRWFPLEKAYPGHTARGGLRVSVCYLMRETSSDSIRMVPYVNAASPRNVNEEAQVQEPKKPARRMKKTSTVAPVQRNTTVKSLQRQRLLQSTDQATTKLEKLKPLATSLNDSLSSPIGRISRAEALSPPSSPSSVASSETGESTPVPTAKVGRRSFPSKRPQKHSKLIESSPPKEEEQDEVQAKANAPRFLKRKPYKVVFHKLDWSGVSSKTNSNLPTTGSSGVAPRPSKTATRASSRAASSIRDTGTDDDPVSNSTPDSFLNAGTALRLEALETAVYERCGVTRDSASLARFKYQTERKKFVAALAGTSTTDEAVSELCKKLTSDPSGQIYAAMLRGLTVRQPGPIEPTDPVGISSS